MTNEILRNLQSLDGVLIASAGDLFELHVSLENESADGGISRDWQDNKSGRESAQTESNQEDKHQEDAVGPIPAAHDDNSALCTGRI
jgi:hypothetical protein